MSSANFESRLTSGEIIRKFHESKTYLTKVVIFFTALIFAVTTLATFYVTMNFSSRFVVEIIIVPAILTIIAAIASFMVTPRSFFVFAILLGIDAGAILRCALIRGW